MKYLLAVVGVLLVGGAWYAFDSGMIPTPVGTEMTWQNASANDIIIDQPLPGASVARSFALTGSARGQWYFEASFPIEVVDVSGNQLFENFVQAQGEWMTTEFVPFSASITIPGNYTGPAKLILHRDNASGLPEHDKSVSIPIVIE